MLDVLLTDNGNSKLDFSAMDQSYSEGVGSLGFWFAIVAGVTMHRQLICLHLVSAVCTMLRSLNLWILILSLHPLLVPLPLQMACTIVLLLEGFDAGHHV